MAAALFGKKEPGDADPSETPSDDNRTDLDQLTGRLADLGQQLAEAHGQIADYLLHRESQAVAAARTEGLRDALKQEIAALSGKIDQLAGDTAPTSRGATGVSPVRAEHGQDARATQSPGEEGLKSLLELFREKLDRIDAGVKALGNKSTVKDAADKGASGASVLEAVQGLQGRLEGGLQRIVDLLAPPEEPEENAAGSAHWEWAILGPDLAQRPNLAFERGQLLSGVLEGDSGACALAGQLLVFQSAPAERLPQLLKDLGEAFYRWHPKTVDPPDHAPHGARSVPGTNPMEEALVEWLRRSCEAAGISNTITLVHPGERFDSTRHTATSRGVEITEVHGWIVLRDNGKVYTKAAVAVQ